MNILSVFAASLVGAAMSLPSAASAQETSGGGEIVHDMYIKLKNASPAAIENQLELGRKYLTGHPGEVSFTPTVIAQGLTRHKQVSYLVNETNFDVAFHLVFKDAKSHDAYQISAAHVKNFIPLSAPNWTTIRIFDSEAK